MGKKLIYIVLFQISTLAVTAQINELGVFLGGSNYIGDIGKTNYINPNTPAFGLIYKWNRSQRHAWRFSYVHSNIKSNDRQSEVPSRKERGLQFTNTINEFSAGLEFNFLPYDLHNTKPTFSPYVYSGLSVFIYDENYFIDKELKNDYQYYSFAIPMTVGFKTRLTRTLILGLETGARLTFTDNLDGSNPKNNNFKELRFGNKSSKDWYVFTGITLTYTFGKNPCFCAE